MKRSEIRRTLAGISIVALALATFSVVGCEHDKDDEGGDGSESVEVAEEEDVYVPYWPTELAKSNDTVTSTDEFYFSTNYAGIGNFMLARRDATWLMDDCGFEVYREHRGGSGDTLEVISLGKGIYMRWAYAGLHDIVVFEPWQGQVFETGVKLGDSLESFVAAYPNAVRGTVSDYQGRSFESWRVSVQYQGYLQCNLTADFAGKRIRRLRLDAWDPDRFEWNLEDIWPNGACAQYVRGSAGCSKALQ